MQNDWLISVHGDPLPRNAHLGLEALRAGDVEAAASWFSAPSDGADSSETLACLIGRAGVARARGDQNLACDLPEQAHAAGRSDATFNLGTIAYEQGDEPLAVFWWDTASRSDVQPVSATAHWALADLMLQLEEYDLADSHLKQAASLGHGEALRKIVWDCLACFDLPGLHSYLHLGKESGDDVCAAMYEVAIVDVIREASTEWVAEQRLVELTQHPDWRVRAALATNPSTPTRCRDSLLNDPDDRVRASGLGRHRTHPPLTTASEGHRVFALRHDLELASMETVLKSDPDNSLLRVVVNDMRSRRSPVL